MDLPFATLTPANVLAKLALSDAYEAIVQACQNATTEDIPAIRHLSVDAQPKYHKDVLQFRREMEHKLREGDISESPTDPDTDTEKEIQDLGMIWTGRYLMRLGCPPHQREMGWMAGKWPLDKSRNPDILICTRPFATRHGLNIRSAHFRFNFDLQNRAFFIVSVTSSSLAGLAVNGETVGRRMHALNQHSMKIQIDSLEYTFQYTDFASSDAFMEKRRQYMATAISSSSPVVFDMPTPRQNTQTIGQWTLGNPLGKGGAGKVFLGSNSKNEVVAVKIMECTPRTAKAVDTEVARCRDLTTLAQKQGDGGRLVRLKEIIDPRKRPSSSSVTFEDIALVLEPMTPLTFSDLIGSRSRGGSRGMSIEAATVFREALLGLKFLHDNGWVHRDVKPRNIGVLPGKPPRAVLLDLGLANPIDPGSVFPATPGRCGTINYLAPEREMTAYDHGADIWAMGVIGHELTYGSHPFKFAANPWRPGEEYEQMRPAFKQRYEEAIDKMSTDYQGYCSQKTASKNPDFIHLGELLVQMLTYPWARTNKALRISVNDALQHPSWMSLFSDDDDPQAKRPRFGEGAGE